ncbi:MAG: HAD family phosphatase [Clostridium sp.]|uniref:HAD family hydrolase n=1 Tax=Clostridium sp. TaxID=1506 RepID=UPI003027503E
MIKNVIFDIGNVLLSFNPMEYLRRKIDNEGKVQEIYEEIFLSEEWLMLDRGIITEIEAVDRLCSRHKEDAELINIAMDNWYELLKPIEETVNGLEELNNKGYKLYYLSNFHDMAFKEINKTHGFFKLFHGGVVSYEEKLLKPEKEIYERLVERYKIIPKESIFIDDTKLNVEAAKRLGFKTIHFQGEIDIIQCINNFK